MERKISLCLELLGADIESVSDDRGCIDIVLNTDNEAQPLLLSAKDITYAEDNINCEPEDMDSFENDGTEYLGNVRGVIGLERLAVTDTCGMTLDDLRALRDKVNAQIKKAVIFDLSALPLGVGAKMLDFSILIDEKRCPEWCDNVIMFSSADNQHVPSQFPWAIRVEEDSTLSVLTRYDMEDQYAVHAATSLRQSVLEALLTLLQKHLRANRYELTPSPDYRLCYKFEERPQGTSPEDSDDMPI